MPEILHKLFVISSPSGGGKTSLIKEVFKDSRSADFDIAISDTSRKKREGDKEGLDYNFVSKQEFVTRIQKEEYLEHAKVFDNLYGTSKKEVSSKLQKSNLILELDWQGAFAIKEIYDEAKLIFIVPPSIKDLEERLEKRNLDSRTVILNRLKESKLEIEKAYNFDYLILNDNFDEALLELKTILFSEVSSINFKSRVSKNHVKRLVE